MKRQILATSGGFEPGLNGQFDWRRAPLVNHALKLTGKERPRICYLGTAGGDSLNGTRGFACAFAGCEDVIVKAYRVELEGSQVRETVLEPRVLES